MPLTNELKYQITADGAKARAEIKNIDTAFNKLGGSVTSQLDGAASSVRGFGGSLGAIPGPAGLAIGAVAGIGTAAVAAGAALFGLTKAAAAYGSMIRDASVKTGLGAESISTLKLAADQSGSSLEQVTGGISKFAKTVGAAGDGSEEAAKKLKALGIDPQQALNDLDGALGKVFKRIGDAQPGVERITLAQKAFGKSGADLIPLMEQVGFSFDEAKQKAKELGVTIGDDAVAAADAFDDQMVLLNAQLEAVTRTIGQALMPTFMEMASDVSGWLARNQSEIKYWGEAINAVLNGVIWQWKMYRWLLLEINAIRLGIPNVVPMPSLDEQVNGRRGGASEASGFGGRRPPSLGGDDEKTGGGKSTKKAKLDIPPLGSMSKLVISSGNAQWDSWFVQMGAKYKVDPNVLLLQAQKESGFRAGAVSPKGAQGFSQFMPGTAARFNVNTASVKDSIRGQAEYMAVLLSMFGGDYQKALAGYNAGEGNVQKYGGIPPFKETRNYVAGISAAYAARVRGTKGGGFGTFDMDAEAEAEIKRAELVAARRVEIGQSVTKSLIELAEYEYEQKLKYDNPDEAMASARQVYDLKMRLIDDEIIALEERYQRAERGSKEEADAFHALELAKIKADGRRLQVEDELARAAQKVLDKDLERFKINKEITDELERQRDAMFPSPGIGPAPEMDQTGMAGRGGDAWDLFAAFDPEKMKTALEIQEEQMQHLKDMTNDTFRSMADAIGQSIAAWALYGDSIGASLKKATAAILANIAAQAIVQAIWETAQGFAKLALAVMGHPTAGTSAAMHFKAAAIYGAIGVGAALGAKALSGGGRGASGGGAGASGQRQVDQNPQTYSRVSENAYFSGQRDNGIHRLAVAVERLDRKVEGMRPGDVLARGANERPGFIGNQVVSDVKRNSAIGSDLMRSAGMR